MTPERLREIIDAGENFSVEFKGEAKEALPDRELVATAVCLANGEGGLILVGVEDDGTITGAQARLSLVCCHVSALG